MKPWQLDQLRRAVEQRRETLLQELNRDAARMREERFVDLAGAVTDGTCGICADCGAEIAFERLLAEPAATRCVECQARHEKTYRR